MSLLDGRKPHIVVGAGVTKVSGVDTPPGTMIRRLVAVNSPSLTAKGELSDYLQSLGAPQYLTDSGLVGGAALTFFGAYEKELKSVTATNLLFAEYW